MDGQCALCALKNEERICKNGVGKGPKFCSTLLYKDVIEKAQKEYEKEDIARFAAEAAKQEASAYKRDSRTGMTMPIKPRIVETMDFCRRMGYHRIGLAFCGALHNEGQIVSKIFKANGFEVVSVMCKVGGVDKSCLGLKPEEKIRGGGFEPMCNPISQAMILNEAKTDFNVLVGLCVGHDSLFLKYCDAMCTVLAVKDRLTGHNPLAAVYTNHSYYAFLSGKPLEEEAEHSEKAE